MSSPTPSPLLRPALIVFGLVFIFGTVALNRLWPSGWAWQPEQPAYLHMILGIYATLGVFLLLAARDPLQHLSLIWFTVWSSVASTPGSWPSTRFPTPPRWDTCGVTSPHFS